MDGPTNFGKYPWVFSLRSIRIEWGASWKSAACPVIKSSNDPNSDTGARLPPHIGARGGDDE